MSTTYQDDEYGQYGDTEVSKGMWLSTELQGDEGFGWGVHWLWKGVHATPKQVAKSPVHPPFMVLHPAYWHGARQFLRQCDEYLCVNPRHFEPRAKKYKTPPRAAWEGVDFTLPDWYTPLDEEETA